jgi:hypothetical protein
MKVQGMNVVNFGNGMEMVMLETHSNERCLKDGGGHVGLK